MDKTGSIVRVTPKGLADNVAVGSVSFPSEVFHEFAQKSTKEIWVTLFDHVDDDLYDGNLQENDSEKPRIKISFTKGAKPTKRKAGATKSKTTKVSAQVVQSSHVETTQNIYEESEKFSVEGLTTELKITLEDLIDSLKNEQTDIQAENDERVGILANLEIIHDELKGEHNEDLQFSKALEDLKDEILKNLTTKRQEIEDRKNDLLKTIKELEEALAKTEDEKKEAQNEKDKLTAIVEAPEDLTEKGFTPEAKNLRDENDGMKGKADQFTEDLLKTRDARNEIIRNHRGLVEEFEETVQYYYDELSKTASSKKNYAYERDNLLKEADFVSLEGDLFKRKIELGEFDIKSLKEALEKLNNQYSDSDKEFNRYTDELRLNLRNQGFIIDDLTKRFAARGVQISDLKNETERQKMHIDHFQGELSKIEQIGYEQKFTDLSGDLKNAEDLRRVSQEELEKAHEDLTIKIQTFADDLEGRKREREEQSEKCSSLITNLQDVTNRINDLLKEIEGLDNKLFTDNNRDRVSEKLGQEREAIDNKLRFAIDERDKIRSELQEALDNMNERNKRLEEQRKIIDMLRKDNDKLKKIIEEKKKIIAQLERDIQLAEEEIDRLKDIVADLERKITDREAEIDRLRELIEQHDKTITRLSAEIGEGPPPEITYKAKKGDVVDEMLAQYIQNCPVPVKRLGDGFYLFGTKKIYAKIMNGKLVIRVGGGYMIIEKFIDTYADQELIKINSILEREGLTSIDQIDLEEYCLKKNRTSYGNTPGEASPSSSNNNGSFRGSFKGSFKKSINGSMRSPKSVKASQIVSHTK